MKNTFVTTARVKIEDVATVAAFMAKCDILVKSKNGPISNGLSLAAEVIRRNHPQLIFNLPDAYSYLNSIGLIDAKDRSTKNMMRALQNYEIGAMQEEEEEVAAPEECFISTEEYSEAVKRREEELEEHIKSFQNISGLDIEE